MDIEKLPDIGTIDAPLPLEPLEDGQKVFELVRSPMSPHESDPTMWPIVAIEPITVGSVYKVKDGHPCEYRYFQSVGGKLMQAFKAQDLLII